MNLQLIYNSIIKALITIIIYIFVPLFLFINITAHSPVVLGVRSFDVLTGSMEPNIQIGSMILSKSYTSYHVGDIITFRQGDVIITHRIVDIKNNIFTTKGDANKSIDIRKVSIGSVIGKVIFIIPVIGKFIGFIKTIPGFIIFIAVPILIYIVLEFKILKQEWEKVVEARVLEKMKNLESS